MCIEKVESFQWAGKLYPTELDAIKAALGEIGARIIKDHANNPLKGLVEHGEHVSKLRARYLELAPAANPTGEALQKDGGGPEDGD